MKRIHYLLLGLLVSLTIAAVSPTLPPTRIAGGSGVTVTTNGVNSFTIAASGGGGGGILTSNGFGTNTTFHSSGTTNWPFRAMGTNNADGVFVNESGGLRVAGELGISGGHYYLIRNATGYGVSYAFGGDSSIVLVNQGLPALAAYPNGYTGIGDASVYGWSAALCAFPVNTAIRRTAVNVIAVDSGTSGIANRGTILAATFTGRAGTSTASFNASGTVYQSITAVGNVGTGEDDLITQTIAANVLASNGDRLRITSVVYFATNANNKEVKLYWNGVNIYTSTGGGAPSACTAVYETIITRTAAATQNIYTKVNSDDVNWTRSMASFVTGSAALSGAVTFKLTGEATATNDIIQKEMLVEYLPAP